MGILDKVKDAGLDKVADALGVNPDVTKLVSSLEKTILKDLGLSEDLKKQIKNVVNNDVAKKSVSALLKKYVKEPNKTVEAITSFVNKL